MPANPRDTFKSPIPVLRPKNVAIVGASDRAAWPRQIHGLLKASGFPGKVFLVNPRQSEVFGEKCYPDLASLPELSVWLLGHGGLIRLRYP